MSKKVLHLILLISLLLNACENPKTKTMEDPDGMVASDAKVNETSNDMKSIDMADMKTALNLDQMQEIDAVIDAFVPPPHLDAPKAKLYLHDPVTDQKETTEIILEKTSDPLGLLTNEAVMVFNCLNEPGGAGGIVNFGGFNVQINLCKEEQVVRPDRDGHYLSIVPPEDEKDPNDTFAEIMMYHHVNEIYEYYKNTHQFVKYDEPLPALVNVQFTTMPRLNFPGFRPNEDGFIPLDNAMFFPKENWEAFSQQFGIPPRDQDYIIFYQGHADFAYDASVIYHEYTHAVIGVGRLLQSAAGRYGLDTSPGGMNEGLADFFAASFLNQAVVGPYGIGKIDPNGGRDLSKTYKCPDHTSWEVHAEGQIIGSTMWAVRNAIGAELTDQIMFNALMLFVQNTTQQQASELILAEAREISPEIESQVREILLNYGLLDCVRSKPWINWTVEESANRLPYTVASKASTGVFDFGSIGTPHNMQFSVPKPVDKQGVRLQWYMEAGGQGFGPSGGAPLKALQLAIRKDQPIIFEFEPTVSMQHDALFEPFYQNGRQEIFISKDCFGDAEQLHTLFINKNGPETWLTKLEIEYVDQLPSYAEFCPATPIPADMGNIDMQLPNDLGADMMITPNLDMMVP